MVGRGKEEAEPRAPLTNSRPLGHLDLLATPVVVPHSLPRSLGHLYRQQRRDARRRELVQRRVDMPAVEARRVGREFFGFADGVFVEGSVVGVFELGLARASASAFTSRAIERSNERRDGPRSSSSDRASSQPAAARTTHTHTIQPLILARHLSIPNKLHLGLMGDGLEIRMQDALGILARLVVPVAVGRGLGVERVREGVLLRGGDGRVAEQEDLVL